MMKFLALVVSLLLSALPSAAETRWMQVGDPQFGKGCTTHPLYEGLTHDECVVEQRHNLHAFLEYAEILGIDDVILQGDLVNTEGQAFEMAQLKAEIEEHEGNLTFHYVLGNHDIRQSCSGHVRALVDTIGLGDRIPHWQTWTVNNIWFFGLNSQLWGYNADQCYELVQEGECRDIAGTSSGTCAAVDAVDAAGMATCDTDEACIRFESYAEAQMKAYTEAVNAYETAYAAGEAKAFFVVSHHFPWDADNADVASLSDGIHDYHNMWQCDDGDLDPPYTYCNDTGFAGANDCGDGGASCTEALPGWDWRTQFETASLPLSTTLYGNFGHVHADLTHSGTTTNGVDYYFVSSTGTSIPYPPQTTLTANIWTCTTQGSCSFDTISVVELQDPCEDFAADTDGDGVCDDGNQSGDPTDNPCLPGVIAGCDDNCPYEPNPGQDDEDGDGVGDFCDNCALNANTGQFDADSDGIGNVCDGDFNNDDFVGGPDFTTFLGCLNRSTGEGVGPVEDPNCEECDMNGDGFVGGPDFTLFLKGFNTAPGPSGLWP